MDFLGFWGAAVWCSRAFFIAASENGWDGGGVAEGVLELYMLPAQTQRNISYDCRCFYGDNDNRRFEQETYYGSISRRFKADACLDPAAMSDTESKVGGGNGAGRGLTVFGGASRDCHALSKPSRLDPTYNGMYDNRTEKSLEFYSGNGILNGAADSTEKYESVLRNGVFRYSASPKIDVYRNGCAEILDGVEKAAPEYCRGAGALGKGVSVCSEKLGVSCVNYRVSGFGKAAAFINSAYAGRSGGKGEAGFGRPVAGSINPTANGVGAKRIGYEAVKGRFPFEVPKVGAGKAVHAAVSGSLSFELSRGGEYRVDFDDVNGAALFGSIGAREAAYGGLGGDFSFEPSEIGRERNVWGAVNGRLTFFLSEIAEERIARKALKGRPTFMPPLIGTADAAFSAEKKDAIYNFSDVFFTLAKGGGVGQTSVGKAPTGAKALIGALGEDSLTAGGRVWGEFSDMAVCANSRTGRTAADSISMLWYRAEAGVREILRVASKIGEKRSTDSLSSAAGSVVQGGKTAGTALKLSETAGMTAKGLDSMIVVRDKELSELRSIVLRESARSTASADIKIDVSGVGAASAETDMDELAQRISEAIGEAMINISEGVHCI